MNRRVISAAKLETYRRFQGDLDGWVRSGRTGGDMRDEDWHLINELRQRLFAVGAGKASQSFAAQTEADLVAHLPDEQARAQLREIVATDLRLSKRIQAR